MFKLNCPRCGAEEVKARLEVVSGRFMSNRVYLEKDGFDLYASNGLDTEDEMVYCHACECTFTLDECYER